MPTMTRILFALPDSPDYIGVAGGVRVGAIVCVGLLLAVCVAVGKIGAWVGAGVGAGVGV